MRKPATIHANVGVNHRGRLPEHSTQPPFARSILTYPLIVWFIIFALLVIITRLQALRFENIDWDESTFIIMASDVMRGHLPYLDVWDNKPPILFFY
jgi:hypothetical protein